MGYITPYRLLTALLMAVMLGAVAPDASARKKSKKTRRKARTTVVAPGPTGPIAAPQPFVTVERANKITRGLEGRTIALWQSHGRYFDRNEGCWAWQRPRLFGTVEDLFPQGFVIPYLMPMLKNAGAYVISPRERDLSSMEIIIDYDGDRAGEYAITNGRHKWKEMASGSGFAMPAGMLLDGDNPFRMGTADIVETVDRDDEKRRSTAEWNADIPRRGRYAVYVSYASLPNSATDAVYTVNHLGGSTHVKINQQMGGGTWIYLGHYDLAQGKQRLPIVELSNVSDDDDAVVSADAVKIGGGIGNVGRAVTDENGCRLTAAITSGTPRFNEGARYWLQWAGMPTEVYSPNAGIDDYSDDFKSRALWVNYLAGGSVLLPDSAGLKIPVDMAFAFHTDAGITDDGTTVGTLGLYSTDGGTRLGNGTSRFACRDLAQSVCNQVVGDIRTLYDPAWSSRGVRDRRYFEVRETKVPAMIIELLSHQNFEDMKRGLDPAFRFLVSRAVYKGILKFIASRYSLPYTVQPLPAASFAISANAPGRYTLSWRSTYDSLEPTAYPMYFMIEERVGNGAFRHVATVTDTRWDVEITDTEIHSYRIIAGNDGGVSFPSETLAVCNDPSGRMPQVMIVNGFTRVSAPAWFETEGFSGFDYICDPGVADGCDMIFTGVQYDFVPTSEFIDNNAPGFGASRANREQQVFVGNTRDYVMVHGAAIKAAGMGFISSGVEEFARSSADGHTPRIVDLILGEQKETARAGSGTTVFKAFTPELKNRLMLHCDAGGSLFVSGAYVGSDLMCNPHSDSSTAAADRSFAEDILGIRWQLSRAAVGGKVSIVPTRINTFKPAGFRFVSELSDESYAVESPDAIRPSASDGIVFMRYDENSLPAATAMTRMSETASGERSYRTVVLGFPFEAVCDAASRNNLMRQILDYLGK